MLSGFTYRINCGIEADIPKLNLIWYAFDEKKITVITSNMISNPVDGTIYTHSHTNSAATQGFVQMNSYRYEGSLNFYLELYQMSLYSVKVKIHNTSNNLSELGYTVVIGSPDFIQASGLIDTGLVSDSPTVIYSLSINSAPIDALLLIPMAGIQTQTIAIRFQIGKSINTATQNSLITVKTWTGAVNGCHIYYAWLFKSKQLPLVCSKYRISRRYEPNNSYFIAFHLIEMNLSYFYLNNQYCIVPQTLTVLNFALEFILTEGKKIIGKIYRCNACGPINYYQFEKKHVFPEQFQFKKFSSFDQ